MCMKKKYARFVVAVTTMKLASDVVFSLYYDNIRHFKRIRANLKSNVSKCVIRFFLNFETKAWEFKVVCIVLNGNTERMDY